MKVVTNWT